MEQETQDKVIQFPENASGKKKVLIVEDEMALSTAISHKLKGSGYEVKVVSDGSKVIDAVQETKFDVVLLDLILPNMDGFDILKAIREIDKNIPIIITSNLSQQEDKQKAKDLGANDYLVKSDIQLADIVKYLDNMISSNTANDNETTEHDQSNRPAA